MVKFLLNVFLNDVIILIDLIHMNPEAYLVTQNSDAVVPAHQWVALFFEKQYSLYGAAAATSCTQARHIIKRSSSSTATQIGRQSTMTTLYNRKFLPSL